MLSTFSEGESFLVRSHHLQKLLEVKQTKMFLELKKKEDKRNPIRVFLDSLVNAINSRSKEFVKPELTYPQDIFGKDLRGEERFKNGVEKYLEEYDKLPGDSRIKIGAFKDGICFACAEGAHCDLTLVNPDYNYGEGFAIDKFQDLARRAKLLHRLSFEDPSEGLTRTITTDKITVDLIICAAFDSKERFVPKEKLVFNNRAV